MLQGRLSITGVTNGAVETACGDTAGMRESPGAGPSSLDAIDAKMNSIDARVVSISAEFPKARHCIRGPLR